MKPGLDALRNTARKKITLGILKLYPYVILFEKMVIKTPLAKISAMPMLE